jgi:lipopolysaccharide transport system ATP-binding protein
VVVVQNVSKLYRLFDRPSDRLLASLPLGKRAAGKDFWAVRDVSFSVQPGEILGIVGPNGSGKSTILQIVAGILTPTSGRVSVEGRTAALLELGAGFNPEFTGRENVFLNSEIMGLSRKETESAFPKIQAFAEIGDFIDRPIKEYSSGMYVRLAFSTAIHVDPEVLIVDEALAVGDAVFANRCVKKLEEMKARNVTILFVSHDLGLIKRLCHRTILMSHGRIIEQGDPNHVVNRYVAMVHEAPDDSKPEIQSLTPNRHGDGASRITNVNIVNSAGENTRIIKTGERVTIDIHAAFDRTVAHPKIGILIKNRFGIDVFGTNTTIEGTDLGVVNAGEELHIRFRFECTLTRQEYTLTAATQYADGASEDWLDDVVSFEVVADQDMAGFVRLKTEIEWEVTTPA